MSKETTIQKILSRVKREGGTTVLSSPGDDDLIEFLDARTRVKLARHHGVRTEFSSGGKPPVTLYTIADETGDDSKPEKAKPTRRKKTKVKRYQHTYRAPPAATKLISILADEASHIGWLVGPTQCGKGVLVKHVGEELGRKVYKISCRGDMGSEAFFGSHTADIDESTGSSYVRYVPGVVEQAMLEGLDEDGNEVGPPGILFLDEIASLPPHVAIGLNCVFESDDPRRFLVLDLDGGRVVRSHSGFRILIASNVAGRGAGSMSDALYSAQTEALDISMLHRVAAFIRMGYDREVEKQIALEKMGDDRAVDNLLKFRDNIRQAIREGRLTSPFSTGNIVKICDMYRVFRDVGEAIYLTTFEPLMPEERAVYNEASVAILGTDLIAKFEEDGIDYM